MTFCYSANDVHSKRGLFKGKKGGGGGDGGGGGGIFFLLRVNLFSKVIWIYKKLFSWENQQT